MGITCKAYTAQIVEIVELPLHMMEGSLVRTVNDAIKKLSDNTRPAAQLFVKVNVVGCLHAKHLKVGGDTADSDLREDVTVQVTIKGILLGKMSKIFYISSIGSLNIVMIKN
jgi:hypothetical protein